MCLNPLRYMSANTKWYAWLINCLYRVNILDQVIDGSHFDSCALQF